MLSLFPEAALAVPSSQVVQIAIYIVILLVAWIVLRTVLRLAMRVFTLGCGAILILGFILLALKYMGKL